MARSDGPEREIWGTWEELLLACAVNRHGTQNWDSVAMEVQSRSPFSKLLTPHGCKQRYYDLHRRFTARNMDIEGGDVTEGIESNVIPWLDELRKIRVAELRREVQRSDVSIVSLQLKVKKLKEERDRSLLENEAGDGKPDLEETKEDQKDVKSSGSPPENLADRISGQDAGRSSNESNWTDPKDRQEQSSEDRNPEEPNGAGAGGGKPDPVADGQEKVAEEGSYNGSSDTIAKAATPAEEAAAAAQAQLPEAGVSGESVAESKGEAVKESSDVQSSVSLTKKRRGRRKAASVGSSGGDEPEADEVSPVSTGNVVISQPLIAVLEIIRSHKYGSIFERRLESQESAGYRSLIRQHMDLEMIRSKLEDAAYTSVELFRDLLLLCNNAIVFFPKNSPESTAAIHLRELVSKEISASVQKSDTSTQAEGRVTTQQQPPPLPAPTTKPEPELEKSLLEKPASAPPPPLIACRKRSSISAKAAASAVVVTEEAKEEERELREEKTDPEKKEVEMVEKKRTKERSSLVGARGLRTSKPRASSNAGVIKSSNPNPNPNPTPPAAFRENSAAMGGKADRKNSSSNTRPTSPISIAKKRSAANFLNRMKRSSPSTNGTLLETLKSSGAGGGGSSSGRGGGEQKKVGKGEARKDQGSRHGPAGGAAAGKKVHDQNAPVKRSVGRPPKRPAPPLPSPPAKRAREADVSPLPPQRAGTRKRGRR